MSARRAFAGWSVQRSSLTLGTAVASSLALAAACLAAPPAEKQETRDIDHQIALIREAFRSYLEADTARDRSIDDDMKAMCDAFAETLAYDGLAGQAAEFERRAVLLAIENVKGPIVDLAFAAAMDLAPVEGSPFGDKEKPGDRFDRALAAMVNGTPKAPTILIYEAADAAAAWAAGSKQTDLTRKLVGLRWRSLVRLVQEHGLAGAGATAKPVDLHLFTRLCAHEIEVIPADLLSPFMNSLLALEELHPCLRETALGKADLRVAWDERGSGTIGTVSDANYTSFQKRLTSAYGHLREAWKLDPSLPDAPTALIAIAMGGVSEERDPVMTWFERAIAARYDHFPAYRAVVQALMPRWGGDAEKLESFGAQCIERGRFETGIPGVYLDTLMAIARDAGDLRWLGDPRVARRLDQLEKGFREAKNEAWTGRVNAWRALTALTTDDYTSMASIDPAAFDMDRSIFRQLRLDPVRARRLIWAHTGGTAAEVAKADALMRAGKHAEASDAYAAVLRTLEGEHAPFERRMALRDLVARSAQTAAFQSGEWVEPITEVALPGWEMTAGVWRPLPTGRGVIGEPTTLAPGLRALPDPGLRFEASAELFISNKKSELASAGFELGIHNEPDRTRSVSVLWYRNRHRIELRARSATEAFAAFDLPAVTGGTGKTSKEKTWSSIDLRIIVWDDDIGIFANGQPLGRATVPPDIARSLGEGLEIGSPYTPSMSDDITATNPRFRRLSARPAELDALPVGGPPNAPPKNPQKAPPKEGKDSEQPKPATPPKRPAKNGGAS